MIHIEDQDEQFYDSYSDLNSEKDYRTDVSLELHLGDPTPELLEYARQHLSERPETRECALLDLRRMVNEQGEIFLHRQDDAFLIRFLRARRFNVEKTHRLLVKYYNFKQQNPELHEDINPLEMASVLNDDIINVLPYFEKGGRRIMLCRLGKWNPSKISVWDLLRTTVLSLELAVLEQSTQILGGICLIDMSGVTTHHVWQMTPRIASHLIALLVTSFPLRIQAVHFVFQSWVVDIMLAIFRPLLNDQMRSRMFFHGNDMESLHAHLDPKFLPEKYGGTRVEYNSMGWFTFLAQNATVVREMELQGYQFPEGHTSQDIVQ